MKPLIIGLIDLYQKILSPDHSCLKHRRAGLGCKYLPTCSEYTKQSVQEHGVIKGAFLGLARVLRCHPWAVQGFDPILKKEGN